MRFINKTTIFFVSGCWTMISILFYFTLCVSHNVTSYHTLSIHIEPFQTTLYHITLLDFISHHTITLNHEIDGNLRHKLRSENRKPVEYKTRTYHIQFDSGRTAGQGGARQNETPTE